MFNLVYPVKKGYPNEKEYQLWKNFIMNTTPLKDREYFKAYGGQDLQEGLTIVSVGGTKLTIYAEKRQSDGTLQVTVIPENDGVEFRYRDMMECLMGAKWKYGEPLVKVYGEIVVTNKNLKFTTDYVTSIFFKTVQEFSFKNENGKTPLIFTKTDDKECD